MEEQWKWIKGYEGIYQISNLGRLKSFLCYKQGKICSVKNSKGWYLTISLRKGKNNVTKRIHRLVYEAFVGKIPKGYHIHHVDGNKQNNNVANLMMLSAREHLKISAHKPSTYAAMVNKNRFGQKHILQFTLNGKFVHEYINAQEAGRATGVCSRNIIQVANKDPYNAKGSIRKQAGGFIWKIKEKGVIK